MRRNRYLEDKAMRRGSMRRDRSSYDSRRGYGRGRDMGMDHRDYYPERDSRGYDRGMSDYRGQDYHRGYEQSREYNRPMEYAMYGVGGIRPVMNDYNDYGYDRDYADMDDKWKEHLDKWCKELKQYDRFNLPKEQIIQKAKQMGVSFNEYDEHEFITTYYMVMSDYPKIANEPHSYLAMAKDWLEDKDSKLKGSEKLCAYYYEVVKGGAEE